MVSDGSTTSRASFFGSVAARAQGRRDGEALVRDAAPHLVDGTTLAVHARAVAASRRMVVL
jgi:hypothetical protein